ncbi:hypothetical protein BN137_2945 [Cronobacter condimenti 1330]|uniref:Secreted protein n=1 Tax=Cronobacter condimenti 1330 TaxID=1073999 RepID=K8A1U6_9ENTR|nr:hypothetical protein [Cronobacter condimenti]ALB62603.1 hypothetical protein AFK62_08865 [Cronobacter condimenti 1330]CCJ73568.1 hypothetical protein BN137_2945 [Cronobacter condimenti 1330]
MKKRHALLLYVSLFMSLPAFASSDESWQTLVADLNRACLSEAGMTEVQTSKPVLFPDETGKVALLLKGRMAKVKQKVSLMCLYDKAKKKAYVSEYQW